MATPTDAGNALADRLIGDAGQQMLQSLVGAALADDPHRPDFDALTASQTVSLLCAILETALRAALIEAATAYEP